MLTNNDISQLYNVTFQPATVQRAVTDTAQKAVGAAEDGGDAFKGFFDAAMGAVNQASANIGAAEQAQIDLATGKTDDILAVMMAQEKAYSSLNFTVQVTNRVIEAYREIMRIQL
ncbi:MAG: flagellar hook-basal body complex protein FliE [Defluviitaleaceae bacterium]|nr:flagellar hook-basal body complex protein FliE [Defluviitaleaceae bacterium]